MKALKFILPLIFYVLAYFSFSYSGWLTWAPMIYGWIVIPGLELLVKPNEQNFSKMEEDIAKSNKLYDLMLYLIVPFQYAALFYFLFSLKDANLAWWEYAGRTLSMGLLCGVFGINVGHELGHRVNKFEQFLAKALLCTSLYIHFFIEHNKGHHKNVATPQDPSSARYKEVVYIFWFRTIIYSYLSAWHIASADAAKKGKVAYGLHNEMLQAHLVQIAFTILIYWLFGGVITLFFLAVALVGILLLETVNYIEHYGLQRRATGEGKYERTMPWHSWNSNHIVGRIMLFELSRHSDHHYMASRKYQILMHHEKAPQLPTGYPGSMLIALVPPLWFALMNKRVVNLNSERSVAA